MATLTTTVKTGSKSRRPTRNWGERMQVEAWLTIQERRESERQFLEPFQKLVESHPREFMNDEDTQPIGLDL